MGLKVKSEEQPGLLVVDLQIGDVARITFSPEPFVRVVDDGMRVDGGFVSLTNGQVCTGPRYLEAKAERYEPGTTLEVC